MDTTGKDSEGVGGGMLHFKTATGATGRTFLVVLDTREPGADGLILWFDMHHGKPGNHPPTSAPLTVAGQFVTDWPVSSVMGRPERTGGTCLWGDEPVWVIPATECREVREWVADCYRAEGREVPAERTFTLPGFPAVGSVTP